MRLSDVLVAAASLGIAAAGVSKPRSSEETCVDAEFTGEVVQYSLSIIEYPIIVDVELQDDTTVTIDNTITIAVTNAPTHLHTTVYAATTSTITKTISTATITTSATAVVEATTDGSNLYDPPLIVCYAILLLNVAHPFTLK